MDIKDYGLKLVLKRKYSKKEFSDKLIKKGYEEDEVKKLVLHFEELGYLDDFDYAKRFVHDSVNLKKRGTRRIILELKAKGIPDEIIDGALSGEKICEPDTIKELILKQNVDLRDLKIREKVIRKLMYKGFRRLDIENVIKTLMEGGIL